MAKKKLTAAAAKKMLVADDPVTVMVRDNEGEATLLGRNMPRKEALELMKDHQPDWSEAHMAHTKYAIRVNQGGSTVYFPVTDDEAEKFRDSVVESHKRKERTRSRKEREAREEADEQEREDALAAKAEAEEDDE